jgi:hypothetical protein
MKGFGDKLCVWVMLFEWWSVDLGGVVTIFFVLVDRCKYDVLTMCALNFYVVF